MNATSASSALRTEAAGSRWDLYKGWVFGFLVIVIVLSVGAGLWFHFHP
jgi:hypothetical protein